MISLTPIKSIYDSFGKQPGYLKDEPRDVAATLEMISYGPEKLDRTSYESLSDALDKRTSEGVNWLIYKGIPSREELELLGTTFNLDNLILEDIQNCPMLRPGYVATEDYLFATVKYPLVASESDYRMTPMCYIGSGNTIVTFLHSDNVSLDPLVDRVVNSKGRIRSRGIDYLSFCHLDLTVDYYFLFLNQLSGSLEQVETKIIASPEPAMLSDLQKLKRIGASMRKSIWPLREMIHAIRGDEDALVSEVTEKYYNDLDSHMLMIFDSAESVREMISGLLEIYLSSVSNRMNEVMKVLTLIATIFIPLTFVAGIYGMNFEFMPELKWKFGYFYCLGVMAVLGLSMFLFFRSRKWL